MTRAREQQTNHGRGKQRPSAERISAAGLVLLITGCSSTSKEALTGDTVSGEKNYAAMCATCHGPAGEGGLGPKLAHWSRGKGALLDIIGVSMPQDDPAKCDSQCAADIADYIMANFKAEPVDCGAVQYAPRKLRLLSRREYNNTVKDLIFPSSEGGPSSSGACQSDAQCEIQRASCVGGACATDPCNLRTFAFPANGKKYSSVHVAGAFNGWSQTVAGAGAAWQMQYVPEKDMYVVKHAMQEGKYEYKFVLDQKDWVSDPGNPEKTSGDGNSVLTVSCAGAGGSSSAPSGFNPAKDFLPDAKPDGYAFDNADTGVVTSVHVTQYLNAAESISALATEDLAAFLPCSASSDKPSCAAELARDFGKRAFRRPLAEDEAAKFVGLVMSQPDFKAGVGLAIAAMLSSPYFLYRSEVGEPAEGGTYHLTPYETASAISYFFWGTMPDQALFDAAEKAELTTVAGIEAQARRLLADGRSRETVGTFASEWLGVERILSIAKDGATYPEFNDDLRQAMVDETRSFVKHVVFDSSHKYEELLTADYTFANDKLASLYGLPVINGSGMQKVSTSGERKAGLLGQGGVLGSYAYADRSSPIHRGRFVRERLLCQKLPSPPAGIPPFPERDPTATTREQLEQHTASPTCHGCHQYIDDVGLGFEHFDGIGKYRETESGQSVDSAGDMNDVERIGEGTHAPFKSLPELGEILSKSESAGACFATQLYRFTAGHLEQPADQCAIDAVAATFAESGHDIQELLIAIAVAPSFTGRK